MYSIAELAVARQHNLSVTWLIIDGGATELARPNFLALAAAFSVHARAATPEALAEVLRGCGRRTDPTSSCCPRGSRCSHRRT
jgi:acetolactate synthase I/II/III large subunit